MNLFPNKSICVALSHDRATSLNKLKQHTKLTNRLVSVYTDKAFIGHVNDSGFKIISSEIGRGALCVFIGELQDSIGTVEIRIHNAFKVLFSILMLLPVVGFGILIMMLGVEQSIGIGSVMIMEMLFVRFVFVELSFRFISKTGFNKLVQILEIGVLN